MLTNDLGKVAMVHYNQNPKVIRVGQNNYAFDSKHGVSLCWVEPGDVDTLVRMRSKSCCGGSKQEFLLANQLQINVWENGTY